MFLIFIAICYIKNMSWSGFNTYFVRYFPRLREVTYWAFMWASQISKVRDDMELRVPTDQIQRYSNIVLIWNTSLESKVLENRACIVVLVELVHHIVEGYTYEFDA